MVFKDRADAGRQLAEALLPYERENCLIFGLPRGGVEVAIEVARRLRKPLDVLVVRKIGAPGHEELAAGAVGPENVLILNRDVLVMLGLQPNALQARIEQAKTELNRRLRQYRGNRPFPGLNGKTAIVVDDGLATGATARAALKALKAMNPAKVVLAVPVGTRPLLSQLRYEVDELVCLEKPENFEAVSAWYERFPQCTDAQVIQWLAESEKLSQQENWQEVQTTPSQHPPKPMHWENLPL
jgi:predicted phosphoribosyltransferase